MFSALRKHVSPTTVLAFIALVFAMTGGAFAASSQGGGPSSSGSKARATTALAVVAKSKSKTKAGARGPAGPRGAVGSTGATGATGPQGAAGGQGKEGPAGKEGPQGKEGSAGKNGENGKEGSPWAAGGTLPPGKTLKGMWIDFFTGDIGATSVSFALPLATAPAVHWIKEDGLEATATGEEVSAVCEGTVADPTAPAGNLCVYTAAESNLSTNEARNGAVFGWKWGLTVCDWGESQSPLCTPDSATPFGFDVVASVNEEGNSLARGAWAVTAAE
jgi:Collagen triple helix repeat (20 copies)